MIKKHTAIASATFALGALFVTPVSANDTEIRVAWYGGNWGDAFDVCIAQPFTEKTGITVIPEIGTSNTTLAKLRQQQSRPLIDVAFLDGGISELAEEDDLLAPMTQNAIPNIQNLQSEAVYANGQDEIFAVGTGYYSLGVTYNTKEVDQAPTSWEELWNDEYAGAVIIPSPANSSGVPFIAFLAGIWDVPMDDLSPVYQKLKALDVVSYFDSSGAASNAFQSGEAIIGAHFNVGAWDLIDKGLPIGFSVPQEGVWATDARLHLVKDSPNPSGAAQFVDQALTAESSQCLAERLYLGPSVKDVTVSDDVLPKMPWGAQGSIANLNLLDWAEINALRPSITDSWNREVVN